MTLDLAASVLLLVDAIVHDRKVGPKSYEPATINLPFDLQALEAEHWARLETEISTRRNTVYG